MESLVLLRTILTSDPGVTAKCVGGIHVNNIRQGDPLPNIVMVSTGSNDDSDALSHQGPNGLLNERIRIWARGKDANEAAALGIAIDKALHGYRGAVAGANVQLIAKVMSFSDFDDQDTVQRAILDFRIHWSRAP